MIYYHLEIFNNPYPKYPGTIHTHFLMRGAFASLLLGRTMLILIIQIALMPATTFVESCCSNKPHFSEEITQLSSH